MRRVTSSSGLTACFRGTFGIAMFLVAITSAEAQPVAVRNVVIRSGCDTCAIVRRRLFVADDPQGMVTEMPPSVMQGGDGTIIIGARLTGPPLPLVFDSAGRYRGELTREGAGPGEIRAPLWAAPLNADTVRVFMMARISDFTYGGRYLGSIRSGGRLLPVVALHLLPSGRFVALSAQLRPPPNAGAFPVEVRAADGTFIRRLTISETNGKAVGRVLGRSREHSHERFWIAESTAARPGGYSLLHMTLEGKILQSVRHEPSWWNEFPASPGRASSAPGSQVKGVHQRRDGKLLVFISQAKGDWRDIPLTPRGSQEMRVETRLVVLDPSSARVLGIATFPRGTVQFLSDTRIAVVAESAEGEPQLIVYELLMP